MIAPDLAARARRDPRRGRRPAPRCWRSAAAISCSGAATAAATARGSQGVGLFPHETVAGDTRMIGDVLLESTLGRRRRGRRRRLREPRRPHAPRRRRRAARRASSPASATTARPASRAAASVARSGRTSTGRCCRATRGSPTCSSPGRSRTRPAQSRAPRAARRRARAPRRTRVAAGAGARGAAAGPPDGRSLGPARAEVDAGVARLPPREEALDRRVQRDAVELVELEEPVAAHCRVLETAPLERPVELAGEDDVDDVLRPEAPLGRDRLDDRNRPFDRQLVVARRRAPSPRRARAGAPRRASRRCDAAARQQPVLPSALLVSASAGSRRASAGSPRRGSAARAHPQRPDEPKPPAPRSLVRAARRPRRARPAAARRRRAGRSASPARRRTARRGRC